MMDRIARAVAGLLDEDGREGPPVVVRNIARRYAHVQLDRLPDDVSGMLIPAPASISKPWIIVVNRDHAPTRQRFTMAHELGHALLHKFDKPHADGAQKIHFRNSLSAQGSDREEIEANRFAAELLMPSQFLVPRLEELGLDRWGGGGTLLRDRRSMGASSEVDRHVIEDLAHEFRVSQEALILRIGTLLQLG